MSITYSSPLEHDDVDQAFQHGPAHATGPRSRATRFTTAAPKAASTESPAADSKTQLPGGVAENGEHEHADVAQTEGDTRVIPSWSKSRRDAGKTETGAATAAAPPPGKKIDNRSTIEAMVLELLEGHHEQFLAAAKKATEETATKAAASLSKISTKEIADRIIANAAQLFFEQYVKRYLKWPFLAGAIVALIILIAVVFAAATTLDRWFLADSFAREVAALHVSPAASSPATQVAVGILLAQNSPATIEKLARCEPSLGLRLVRSQGGEQLCVGGGGAVVGFRAIPSQLR